MNEFELEIGEKTYTLTVTRRNNLLSRKNPNENLFKLLDLGLSEKDISEILRNPTNADVILKKKGIPTSKLYAIMSDDMPDNKTLEEMFYQFIIVRHPEISREMALDLMDEADIEYGRNETTGNLYLNDLLVSISQRAFIMSENLKRVDWFEIEKKKQLELMKQLAMNTKKISK